MKHLEESIKKEELNQNLIPDFNKSDVIDLSQDIDVDVGTDKINLLDSNEKRSL